MKPDFALVRDALPLERLSCSRIRQWLEQDCGVGDWSRTHPAAIRPQRLAALLRDRIWEAHDVTLAAVRERLNRAGGAEPPGTDYWVGIKVEKQPDDEFEVRSRTRFSLTSSERICAEIFLAGARGDLSITSGPVPLRRRSDA